MNEVIGLWAAIFGAGDPKWLVSRDAAAVNAPPVGTPIRIFDHYEEAEDFAMDLAAEQSLRLIRTDRGGKCRCIFRP